MIMNIESTHTILRNSLGLTAALSITLMMLASASATTLLKLDLETLTSKSEAIVQGTVSEIEYTKQDGRIYTYITLNVKEVLKGSQGMKEVQFRVLGGRVGDLITVVHGTPQFQQDEEVLVFLERPLADKPLVVTGMVQGKFHVAVGPDQQTEYIVPDIKDTPLVEPLKVEDKQGQIATRLKETEPDQTHSQVITLDAFKLQIKELQNTQK